MLRRLGGVGLVAATIYFAADAATDSLLYARAKSLVETQAAASADFQAQLGAPLVAGPWYNSSVVSAGPHLATVTLPMRGSRRSSDVTVRLVRRGGLHSTLLYCLTGGEWEVLVMNAMIGMGPGGRPVSMSLLPQPEPADEATAAAAAAAMGHDRRTLSQAAAAHGDGKPGPATEQQQHQAAGGGAEAPSQQKDGAS